MLNSPVSSLYHSLHQIYTPLLLKDAKWSQEFDPKLQNLITELEKGLGNYNYIIEIGFFFIQVWFHDFIVCCWLETFF